MRQRCRPLADPWSIITPRRWLMSVHYILDGYNIIHQIPALDSKKIRDDKEHLIDFVERYKPQGSRYNQVTIVFDGHAPNFSNSSPFEVVFSKDVSADEKIRELVKKFTNKKNTIVISDDRELRFSVRALGAQVLDVKSFLLQAKSLRLKPAEKGQGILKQEEKNISKVLEYKITDELKKRWLKEK